MNLCQSCGLIETDDLLCPSCGGHPPTTTTSTREPAANDPFLKVLTMHDIRVEHNYSTLQYDVWIYTPDHTRVYDVASRDWIAVHPHAISPTSFSLNEEDMEQILDQVLKLTAHKRDLLREDYEHERGRVDKFIDRLLGD